MINKSKKHIVSKDKYFGSGAEATLTRLELLLAGISTISTFDSIPSTCILMANSRFQLHASKMALAESLLVPEQNIRFRLEEQKKTE